MFIYSVRAGTLKFVGIICVALVALITLLAFMPAIRGVDSSGVMRSFVERNLLQEHGRLTDVPGRPIAYRTTDNFLRCFKLNSLDDLPPIPGSTDQITLEEYDDDYIPDEENETDEPSDNSSE